MDDIRNTSALFVGGQDAAPHTERTDRELWQLLFQKTENEMAAYMNSLNQLPRSELIMAADEISAMATCRAELMALGEDDLPAAPGKTLGASERGLDGASDHG